MRKTVVLLTAGALTAAVLGGWAALPDAAQAVVATPLTAAVPGSLEGWGGTAGWANHEAGNLTVLGLDAAEVGQAYEPTGHSDVVVDRFDGIGVEACCGEKTFVKYAVGDAQGTLAINFPTANDTNPGANLSIDPAVFTATSPEIATLIPPINFSVETSRGTAWYTYYLSERRLESNPNNSVIVDGKVRDAIQLLMDTNYDVSMGEMAKEFTDGFALALTTSDFSYAFSLSSPIDYSIGYDLGGGLGNGETVDLTPAVAGLGPLLSGQAVADEFEPVPLSQVSWRDIVPDSFQDAVAGTPAAAQLDAALNSQAFWNAVSSRFATRIASMASVTGDLVVEGLSQVLVDGVYDSKDIDPRQESYKFFLRYESLSASAIADNVKTLINNKMNAGWLQAIRNNANFYGNARVTFTAGGLFQHLYATGVTVEPIELSLVQEPLALRSGASAGLQPRLADPGQVADGSPLSFAYVSADPAVATVDADGLVTGRSVGSTSVAVTAEVVCVGGAARTVTVDVPVTVVAVPLQGQLSLSPTGPVTAGNPVQVTAQVSEEAAPGGAASPRAGAEVAFWSSPAAPQAFEAASCKTGADGSCSVAFRPTADGPYEIHASLAGASAEFDGAGDPAKASPRLLTVMAGAPDQAKTVLTAVPSQVSVGGAVALTARVRDLYDNPVSGLASNAFDLSAAGFTVSSGPLEGSGETAGDYVWNLQAEAIGPLQVKLKLAAFELTAPVQVASCGAAAVDLAIAYGGQEPAFVSEAAQATVEARLAVLDACSSAPIPGLAEADLTWSAALGATVSTAVTVQPGSFKENSDHSYSVLLSSTEAGAFDVTVAVQSVTAVKPVRFQALRTADGLALTAEPAVAFIPDTVQLTLTAKDRFGNGISLTAAQIGAVASLPAGLAAVGEWSTTADAAGPPTGVYKVDLAASAPGDYTVLVHPAGLDGSPEAAAAVSFQSPVIDPAASSLAVDRQTASVSSPDQAEAKLSLHLQDSQGRPVRVDPATAIAVTSTPAGVEVASAWSDLGDGVYEALISTAQVGSYELQAVVSGVALASLPVSIDFTPCADVSVSWVIEPAEVELPRDGRPGQAAGQLTVVYACGNPADGLEPVIAADGPGSLEVIAGPASAGVYNYTLSTAVPGLYSVSAQLPGQPEETASLRFFGGPPDPARSDFSPDAAVATASGAAEATLTATVSAQDALGAPIVNLAASEIGISSSPAGVAVVQGSFDASQAAAGLYTVKLFAAEPGLYELRARILAVDLDIVRWIEFIAAPSPSPTPVDTPSPSESESASPSPSEASASPSPTVSPTEVASPSPVVTPSPAESESAGPSPSVSPTEVGPSPVDTPSPVESASPSPVVTPSPAESESAGPSPSEVLPSPSPSESVSPSPLESVSPSELVSASPGVGGFCEAYGVAVADIAAARSELNAIGLADFERARLAAGSLLVALEGLSGAEPPVGVVGSLA
ncbi:MAG: Ig-like domain-containing protein, partial [Propionibacteriaceae bacterium]|nr:Ig-like domain-containing protein [Propionibacteriaceae bacterium]